MCMILSFMRVTAFVLEQPEDMFVSKSNYHFS